MKGVRRKTGWVEVSGLGRVGVVALTHQSVQRVEEAIVLAYMSHRHDLALAKATMDSAAKTSNTAGLTSASRRANEHEVIMAGLCIAAQQLADSLHRGSCLSAIRHEEARDIGLRQRALAAR